MSTNFNPVLPCSSINLIEADILLPEQQAQAEIKSAIWKNENKDNEIKYSAIEKTICIEVKTVGFENTDKVTIEIKENKDDGAVLKSLEININTNECITDTEGDNKIVIDKEWINKELKINVSSSKTESFKGKTIKIICCEAAIGKDSEKNEGELIKELNIRLAGFAERGAPLPQKKFTKETENAVKQFQRDYMKVEQTGVVCKHFLKKLDEFCEEYYIKIDSDKNFKVKCPCKDRTANSYRCTTGFGKGRSGDFKHKHTYKNLEKEHELKTKIEAEESEVQKALLQKELDDLKELTVEYNYIGIEKPGIHRSLLWVISAMKFYLKEIETKDNLTLGKFDSSYRCKGDNIDKFSVKLDKNNKNDVYKRLSNNHMGNAIDIHIYKNGKRPTKADERKETCDKIRMLFAIYCGAQIRWEGNNLFSLEPSEGDGAKAPSWVHIDCRQFSNKQDTLYCKSETDLKGEKLLDLLTTSDNKKWDNINNCNYEESEKESSERMEDLWLGIVKDTASIQFKDKKWTNSTITGPNDKTYRKQNVVDILEETDDEYKIAPRGSKSTNEGWVKKDYIEEIFKFKTN